MHNKGIGNPIQVRLVSCWFNVLNYILIILTGNASILHNVSLYLYSIPNKPICLDISHHGNALHYLGWIRHDSYVMIFWKGVKPSSFSHTLLILMTFQTSFYNSSHDLFHTSYYIPLFPSSNSATHLWIFPVILSGIMVVNRHEPETYADLEALPKYEATKHIFQKAGWEPFFKKFDGYDDSITL